MSLKLNSEIAVVGIDIGKNGFHIVGLACPMKSKRWPVTTRPASD
jgi:hypothetical protein